MSIWPLKLIQTGNPDFFPSYKKELGVGHKSNEVLSEIKFFLFTHVRIKILLEEEGKILISSERAFNQRKFLVQRKKENIC